MPRELVYGSSRDTEVGRLLDEGLNEVNARECRELLASPAVQVLSDGATDEATRVLSLCHAVRALIGPKSVWADPDTRKRLSAWAGPQPRPGRTLPSKTERWKDLAEEIARPGGELPEQWQKTARRHRVKLAGVLAAGLFTEPLPGGAVRAALLGYTPETELVSQVYAGGVHPKGQFKTQSIGWDYHLDRDLRLTEFVDSRVLVPLKSQIAYWSIPVLYTEPHSNMNVSVEGGTLYGEPIVDPLPTPYLRYIVKFDRLIDAGDEPIEVTWTFVRGEGRSGCALPNPALCIAADVDVEGPVRLAVHFNREPADDIYAMRCPASAFPVFRPDSNFPDNYSFRRYARRDRLSYFIESEGLRAGYGLGLTWA